MARLICILLLSAPVLGPQVQNTDAGYSVAYIDILPSSKAKFVAALKDYEKKSQADKGYVRLQLFEQIERPGHFAIIETWNTAEARDLHTAGQYSKQFLTAVEPMRVSDYDQRPYKGIEGLTPGSLPANATAGMLYVITHVDTFGPQANAPELLRRFAEESRKDQGNLAFDVLQHASRPNHFTIVELWRDAKAHDAHVAASHTKQYRNNLAPISGSPLDERLYRAIELIPLR